jgi:hypothetical protein
LPHERGQGRRSGANALDDDIEAVIGFGDAYLGLTLFSHQWRERLPEFWQGRHDAWEENRANLNTDQLVRAGEVIAKRGPLRASAKGETCPPPAAERNRSDLIDLGVEPARSQRGHDLVVLPTEICPHLHVLERAAAAHAEMRADRSDALGALLKHVEQRRVVALGIDGNPHPLARQSERHEDRPVGTFGHRITLGSEPSDLDLKLHGGRRSGFPHCHCLP